MTKKETERINQFTQSVCPTCVAYTYCHEDDHFKTTCPHYAAWDHSWEPTFVQLLLRRQREHPEEAEQLHNEQVEHAKRVKEQIKKEKKEARK